MCHEKAPTAQIITLAIVQQVNGDDETIDVWWKWN